MKIATWSFDDGGPADLPVLEVLCRHKIPATFYLVVNRVDGMDPRVYDSFEVGSHTMTHPKMRECTPERRRYEIETSRAWLAAFIGKPPVGIAWPGGGYIPECGAEAARAGYAYGRGFYVTAANPRTAGAPWNRGITVKFKDEPWTPAGDSVHLAAHPAEMDLELFEATLKLMLDAGYSFLTNAEFFSCV